MLCLSRSCGIHYNLFDKAVSQPSALSNFPFGNSPTMWTFTILAVRREGPSCIPSSRMKPVVAQTGCGGGKAEGVTGQGPCPWSLQEEEGEEPFLSPPGIGIQPAEVWRRLLPKLGRRSAV